MSHRGWDDRFSEGRARKPGGRTTSSGGRRHVAGSSSRRLVWRPVNAQGGGQLQVHDATGFQPPPPHSPAGLLHTLAPPPRHHGEPSGGFSSQFDSMNLQEGIPKFPARTSTTNPGLDGHKRNQALPEEHKVAPSSPVQLDLKRQTLPHQPNKFVGRLKNTVEITHAEAHEELKLNKRMEPSAVTPMQIMHKAKKKYVVGKVSDRKEVKQRQLNAILNKLTPRNFVKLRKKVEVKIDNAATLSWFVSQMFCRVLMEQTFSGIYADLCFQLSLPDFYVDNERITFKRLLLNNCQHEFERGERKEPEAGKTEEEGGISQTKEEREERRIAARRRMLCNIRFIGELYKRRMLIEPIIHKCIKELIGDYIYNPDEANIEGLCTLMTTVGEMMDHPKSKERVDGYFDIMESLSRSQKLSFRVRFLLRDLIDLRKNKWQQKENKLYLAISVVICFRLS